MKNVDTSIMPKGGGASPGKTLDAALKHVTPDYGRMTPTQREAQIGTKVTTTDASGKATTIPRVNPGGPLQGRSINLTSLEKEAGTEISKLPGFKPGMSNLDVHTLTQSGIETEAKNLESLLQKEGQVIPKKQIVSVVKKAIDKVPGESLILQKSDPVIKKYISSVKNAADQVDGTLKGALDIRKAMDKAYAQAGKHYPVGTESRGALDEVHQASRDALYKFLVDNAKNTDVKASLRKQWNLFRASDAVLPKAAREAGSSLEKIQKFMKEHPIGTAAGAAIGGAAAGRSILSGGMHL
jgi:hypothetical protein